MEKSFDLLIKIVDEVKSYVNQTAGVVDEHDKQLIKIIGQLEFLTKELEAKKQSRVWIRRTLITAIVSSGVGAFIGMIVSIMKGG